MIGSSYLYIAENRQDPLEKLVGQGCTVYGRVLTVQEKNEDYYKIIIKCPEFGKRLVNIKGNMEDPADLIGRMIRIKGKVELPSARRNPGLFDYKLYLKTKGIRVILSTNVQQMEINYSDTNYFLNTLALLKYNFMEKLEQEINADAYGIFVGMLFGDRNYMSENIYDTFQNNGIAHILSVSGLHVGIIYLYINKLLGGRRSPLFSFIAFVMLISYAALAEFSPSVVRAVLMITIHIVSKLTFHRYDFTNCASVSALGILLVNPFYLFNTGFQLSYLAVFCLAVLLPWTNRQIERFADIRRFEIFAKVLPMIAPLLVIQIGMAPFTSYVFNYFSIVSFLINIPVIAIAGVIIPIGICLIPMALIGGLFFGVGAALAELLLNSMIWLNNLFYLPGIGFFNVVSPPIGSIIFYYGILFLLTSEFVCILYLRKKFKLITSLTLFVFFISILSSFVIETDASKAEFVFLDVGQGDCLHIRTPSGKNILIDGGGNVNYDVGKNILLPYLLKNKVKLIDLAIVSHLHNDHYLGLAQLAQNMEIKKFGTYEANKYREEEILTETGLDKEDMIYLTSGERIEIEKDIWIDVIYPEKRSDSEYVKLIEDEEDENKSCLFVKVYYMGLSVLMTGDIGFEGEDQIMEIYENMPELLSAEVLKVGHHGSRYSTGDNFLEVVAPKIAVFQVGTNNFGHPHPTVIEKCEKHSIMFYRNDLDGAIILDRILLHEEAKWHIRTLLRESTHLNE